MTGGSSNPRAREPQNRRTTTIRDDFAWSRLTPEQRESAESWLFDENASHANAQARLQDEFGVQITIATIARFCRCRARERHTALFAKARAAASQLDDLPASIAGLRQAAVQLVGKTLVKLAGHKPRDWEPLASFTRLLLDNENTEIRRARLNLAQRCFDYEATAAAQKDLPQLRAYLRVILDNMNLDEDEKSDRINAILYGWNHTKSHD